MRSSNSRQVRGIACRLPESTTTMPWHGGSRPDKSGRERALCTDEAKAHDVSARKNARIESKTAEAGK